VHAVIHMKSVIEIGNFFGYKLSVTIMASEFLENRIKVILVLDICIGFVERYGLLF